MKSSPINPSKDIWLPLLFALLGIFLPILATEIFRDRFYPALVITVLILVGFILAFVSARLMKTVLSILTVLVAVVLVILYRASDRPGFEINFIGLPLEGDNAYYVTNAFIRTGGDLSAYEDIAVKPLSMEVIPHYAGDERFGNVFLRVSGSAGVEDIPLWSDFDRSAQTKTVELELSEIVRLSGIQRSRTDLETNLMLGEHPYQEEVLTFEVIRISAPEQPFEAAAHLPVRNTPWKQEISLTYRDGLVLDYALTNFGGETRFGCDITVGQALADVTFDPHDFWSGATGISYGPDCEPFSLQTGETHTLSIPLNEETIGQELPHGRYLVQVFSFAERGDLVFEDGSTFETYGNRWLYGDDGDIETFVICHDPGMSCEETDTLPVEEQTIKAFPFTSDAEHDNGITYFVVRTLPTGNRSSNHYILDYWIDPQREGWAGFAIWFEQGLDASAFSSIRFKLRLDESAHPLWFDVKYKAGDGYGTARVELGSGGYGTATSDEQTIVVPFSAFRDVDWTRVDTLYFGLDSYRVPDAERHQIQVSEVEFVR